MALCEDASRCGNSPALCRLPSQRIRAHRRCSCGIGGAGSRITLNRFLPAVRTSAHEDKIWTARLHSQLYCCIEEGMLHGEAFMRHYERVPITVASAGEVTATCGVVWPGHPLDGVRVRAQPHHTTDNHDLSSCVTELSGRDSTVFAIMFAESGCPSA